MPKISAPTLEKHRAETVDRLLDAFGELILSRGYADVSLADVAAQAGLARTAIYNYFPDRETLLFSWTDREVRRTLSILEHELEAAPTYAEKIRTFVRLQLLDFTRRHLPPGREVVGMLRPETYGNFMRHVEPLEQIARQIVTEGIEAGEFVETEPGGAVQMMMACIGSERAPLTTRTHSLEESTERVGDFILRALGAKVPARKKPAPKRKRAPKP